MTTREFPPAGYAYVAWLRHRRLREYNYQLAYLAQFPADLAQLQRFDPKDGKPAQMAFLPSVQAGMLLWALEYQAPEEDTPWLNARLRALDRVCRPQEAL